MICFLGLGDFLQWSLSGQVLCLGMTILTFSLFNLIKGKITSISLIQP